MPLEFNSSGVSVETFDEVLDGVQENFRSSISTSIATSLDSSAGQMQRQIATPNQLIQEKIQQMYQAFDPRLAEGVHLDQRNSLLGISRLPAARAEVLGTATFSAAATLTDGFRVSVGGFEFSVIGGPYAILGAGTITDVRLRSSALQPIDVSTLGAWSLVDVLAGFDSFDDTSQPIAGRRVETDTEFRARAEIERFRRASGPLAAIDANVLSVTGVTYARAWHHVDPALGDPDPATGIPLWAINVVVEGGDDAAVAEAIQQSGPAGSLFYGTDVSVVLGTDTFQQTYSFDRVSETDMWIRATLTTSTSEETGLAAGDLTSAVQTALAAFATSSWIIGKDALPVEVACAIIAADVPGIDAITIELSTDDGVGDAYSNAKRSISLRQRAVYDDARLTIVEV